MERTAGPTVGIFVDYESPLARVVAGSIWTGLSLAALGAGYTKTTARWESLREERVREGPGGPRFNVFVVGQDRPDAVDQISPVGDSAVPHLYGVVVAVPDRPSPLAGSLLYQGVGRLTERDVRAGSVEPALLHPSPKECESYARRLLERLQGTA
ncbi:hypothetical protein GBA65_20905 [Rubrobacter marinus]|uniref:Uncharacterized protein n=1 Tax=Rubrobacter marinus TaxID=2653852 RepID=A0A6G8Q251_9ACTN|nr:hypothetical protein [Rubrobacter marinus]QIN80561.1 hypothetical protein GBA65_20905 [Rubrobacter marinus]